MWQIYLLVGTAVLAGCTPGQSFQPGKDKKSNATAQPIGSDAIPAPSDADRMPVDDPEEEGKAIEPAIIGGAYLYCDADESKSEADAPTPMMVVGCRVGNVPEADWMSAEKSVVIMNSMQNATADIAPTIAGPGSPYHIVFSADRRMQNVLELQVDVMLPQGQVTLGSTINPGALKAIEQRLGKGLALYSSTGSDGDWPGMDRKTWNLWMPLRIPRSITNFNPPSPNSGPGGPNGGDRTSARVELMYDETVCTYELQTESRGNEENRDYKIGDFVFESCTKTWQPGQWVRSKTLTLRLISSEKRPMAAGVILETGP